MVSRRPGVQLSRADVWLAGKREDWMDAGFFFGGGLGLGGALHALLSESPVDL